MARSFSDTSSNKFLTATLSHLTRGTVCGFDKIRYKSDKICIVCSVKFGPLSYVKKYCKFCYRAVC